MILRLGGHAKPIEVGGVAPTNFNNAKFTILLEMPDGSAQRSKPFRRFKGWA
jgi:hypothetical protein